VQRTLRRVFNDESIVFDKSRFAGGLTNYNYIMNIQGTEYVVREPGGMTNRMIDRRIEKVNNRIASELGLNSECIYFDDLSGIKISVFIKNSRNMALTNPCRKENLRAVSALLKKIHNSPEAFTNVFDWRKELAKYEQIVRDLKGDFFYDYDELKKQLVDFMEANVTQTVSVPCHNDTVPENFLITDEGKAYLIDWEYSGLNDPSWDIAAYILESKLDQEAIEYLLNEYYGCWPEPEVITKIKGFMLAQDLIWTVWALVRHYNGDDFLDYCYLRYERFRKNVKEIVKFPDYSLVEMVNS